MVFYNHDAKFPAPIRSVHHRDNRSWVVCLDDGLFAFGQMAKNGPFVDVERIRNLLYGQIALRTYRLLERRRSWNSARTCVRTFCIANAVFPV